MAKRDEISREEQISIWKQQIELEKQKREHINSILKIIDPSDGNTIKILKTMRCRSTAKISRLKDRIWRIEPSAVPEKHKSLHQSNEYRRKSLNQKRWSGDRVDLIDYVIQSPWSKEFDPTEKLELMKYAVQCIPKQAAIYLDQRLNKGYSLAKIASINNSDHSGGCIHRSIKRSLQRLQEVVKVKSLVIHLRSEEEFSFEELIEKCPEIFTANQIAIMKVILSKDPSVLTVRDLANRVEEETQKKLSHYTKCSMGNELSYLKRKFLFIGVPEKAVNSLHYLFRSAKVTPFRSANHERIWSNFLSVQ